MAPRKAKQVELPIELPEVIAVTVPDSAPIVQTLAVPKLISHPQPTPQPVTAAAPVSHGPLVSMAVGISIFFGLLGGRN